MTKLFGHVALGFTFSSLGLWRLFNNIKLHSLHPNSFTSPPWFPSKIIRHIELFSLMAHATISLNFFTYAAFAIILDKIGSKAHYALTLFLEAIAFGQELLLIHFHSADHKGVESQYHLLLQIILLVSLITTLMTIGHPQNFLLSFVRSTSITFNGVWLIVTGFMLWTPALIPKGCFINLEEEHQVVRCLGDEDLLRAKSLVNLQFSWFLIAITVFSVSSYLVLDKIYDEKLDYSTLS
ncbi:proteinase inhibitor I4 serpin (DUF716) [Citrus sinensis]|uniref:Proteinase inhibitor I4 serpin (DUF716) n=1 Tax=Citrus sinensis TaxID=2711 RepID=A0ACB8MUG2_CITSI|nr:proteinase inhibitor I4 serpin (DUF716) [Citrus sinensis]KAH9789251.1 proteinase inhibitor I4 serpin (DUF716) [Citrus sinensis]